MTIAEILKLVELLRWPTVILVIFFFAKESIFNLISKYRHVEVGSSTVKLILKNLEKDSTISSTQIKKLKGLTGHDFWALDAFMKQTDDKFKYVSQFNPTKKAMVHSFVEMGLLEFVGEGDQKQVKPTQLASDIILAANKLM